MHLKSLTLRGFKSFASATSLEFEPGITCVVGPNGSGKSNIIDAIAWVLGEQGARTLRGGSMSDVVFAGTAGRPALGRAEVTLVIDNSDGAVPIPHAEITLTRTMFRSGGSEYAINGSSARLIDVVELLSDAGVGREMHVIVGQGSLDTVLSGSPADRRGLLEEAAGVLKHRKRKEKALRKLEAMQVNLNRVQDLTAEVNRQLKPLGRQAEAARKAVVLQADLRDSTLRLLADDLGRIAGELDRRDADEALARERREACERDLAELRGRQQRAEETAALAADQLRAASSVEARLGALRERLRGTAALAAERRRSAESVLAAPDGGMRTPEDLDREGAAHDRRIEQLEQELLADRERLAEAVRQREAAEEAFAQAERAQRQSARAAADAREARARLAGAITALQGRIDLRDADVERLTREHADAMTRAEELAAEAAEAEGRLPALEEDESALTAAYEAAHAAQAEVEERVGALADRHAQTQGEHSSAAARREALELAVATRTSSGSLADVDDLDLGSPLAGFLEVAPGFEAAVAAALGSAVEAPTAVDLPTALRALRAVRDHDLGSTTLVVLDAPEAPAVAVALPSGARAAVEVVTASGTTVAAVRTLLAGTVVVEEAGDAPAVLAVVPGATVVTRDGEVITAARVQAGSTSARSTLELQAAAAEAADREAETAELLTRLQAEREEVESLLRPAREAADRALAELHDSDAALAAVAERLAQLAAGSRAAEMEAQRLADALTSAQAALEADRAELPALQQRLAGIPEDEGEAPEQDRRDELAAVCTTARATEVESRLAVRVTEERLTVEQRRREGAIRAAERERAARAEAQRRRAAATSSVHVAARVEAVAASALTHLEALAAEVRQDLATIEGVRQERARELSAVRERVTEVTTELERLRSADGAGGVARIEARLRLEALQQRARDDFGMEPEAVVAEYGPEVPVPGREEGETSPYVREEQEERRRIADKALAALGSVNPLALEEYAALEERHRFLRTQVEDLHVTRRELMSLVGEVDERVQQIFAEAFADTAREFETAFARLFPGGEGRLVLTDPDDMLATGIEVEARPPGKRVKRLSLLSGGERSLTALAFLVALFRARPSPFYVLDEVEAALDDVNLGRMLELFEELRESSQLIVVTHQKRTMDVADALYGVTMRGDGVSAVIGQRMREREPA